jgi:glutathione synthase/RimK-type ligase-like ATP-grasp enzyme
VPDPASGGALLGENATLGILTGYTYRETAISVPASGHVMVWCRPQGVAVKKVGIIFGMETTFPPALVDKINSFNNGDVKAELASIGEVRMAEPSPYDVIIDRISHDIPFYRGYLKNAALSGSIIINNPFWWSADDKFFNFALGTKLGVAIPKTVLLPHKHHPAGTTGASMRNLEYPMPWDSIFTYVGFPAFLKPFDGGGWRDVYKVSSPNEFFDAYDQTRTLCMTLQTAVNFKEYFRCYCVGQEKVHIMQYDPSAPFHERYVKNPAPVDPKLLDRVERDCLTLCRALGYDLNTVEFACEDGIPYAIDFMNPAPDADVSSVGQANFDWIVNQVAELAIEKARKHTGKAPEYRWSAFLGGPSDASANGKTTTRSENSEQTAKQVSQEVSR